MGNVAPPPRYAACSLFPLREPFQAAAATAAAAADPWRVGGRGSRFVRLERPSVIDPVRDGSRRRAAASTWNSSRYRLPRKETGVL